MRKQLTNLVVERTAPPPIGRVEIFDKTLSGFALRITSSGARSFIVRGRVKGQATPIRVTLGDATAMSLDEARQAALDTLKKMRAGTDPRPPKIEPAGELTLDKLVDEWSRLYLARDHRPRYAREAPAGMRKHLAELLGRPAAQVTKADAVNALDKITLAGWPGAAHRVMGYARACFGWALKRGKVSTNPFANLPDIPTSGARERVLSDAETGEVWEAAGSLGYPWEPFFKLAMLTVQRREEVAGTRWSEIDFDKHLWRIPGARMKQGKPHDVHLSEPALAVLRSIPRLAGSDFVFTTTGRSSISGFSKAKQHLDAAIAKARTDAGNLESMPPWWLHDFRRTGVTTLAALGFDSIVADKLLAHQPAKLQGVAAVYQRHDFARERAAALDAWAAHVTGKGAGENVVPLRVPQ